MPAVATDYGISNAFGRLEIAKRPSTKGVPKTSNKVAYIAVLSVNIAE